MISTGNICKCPKIIVGPNSSLQKILCSKLLCSADSSKDLLVTVWCHVYLKCCLLCWESCCDENQLNDIYVGSWGIVAVFFSANNTAVNNIWLYFHLQSRHLIDLCNNLQCSQSAERLLHWSCIWTTTTGKQSSYFIQITACAELRLAS